MLATVVSSKSVPRMHWSVKPCLESPMRGIAWLSNSSGRRMAVRTPWYSAPASEARAPATRFFRRRSNYAAWSSLAYLV
jgi:hypothetical protein